MQVLEGIARAGGIGSKKIGNCGSRIADRGLITDEAQL
jgi:hypothetical protein